MAYNVIKYSEKFSNILISTYRNRNIRIIELVKRAFLTASLNAWTSSYVKIPLEGGNIEHRFQCKDRTIC